MKQDEREISEFEQMNHNDRMTFILNKMDKAQEEKDYYKRGEQILKKVRGC